MKIKTLIDETFRFYKELKRQKLVQHPQKQVSQLHNETHNESPIFVLSTGRAGTMLLTEILALSKKLQVKHEPDPILNYYSKSAWAKEMSDIFYEGVFEGARYEQIRDAFILNKTYIETNNRLTFLAPHIKKRYPNAKFVHLIRAKEDFVKSGLKRQWYSGKSIHDEGRISKANWEGLNEKERIEWLWSETNTFIQNFFLSLKADEKMTVKSEDLFHDTSVLKNLLLFCNADDVSIDKAIRIRRKKINK